MFAEMSLSNVRAVGLDCGSGFFIFLFTLVLF